LAFRLGDVGKLWLAGLIENPPYMHLSCAKIIGLSEGAAMDWDDLKYVLETVRHGGLSGAARALGVNHATVSRRIAHAEAAMGALLFDRLPSGYAPTDAGRDAARTAEAMEAAQGELSRQIGARDQALSGKLVITAPQLLIEHVLAPILVDFCALHPEIELHVSAANEPLNLAQREADVAIRVADAPPENLHGVRIAELCAAAYVSPAYSARLAKSGGALAWLQIGASGIPPQVRAGWAEARIGARFDDMVAMRGAVRAGLGAARLPCFVGDSDPLLVRLSGVPIFNKSPIWVLTHADLRRVRRIEAFTSFAAARLRGLRGLFEGHEGG
jgi:DNA-binding transcriptional LysR family regulator